MGGLGQVVEHVRETVIVGLYQEGIRRALGAGSRIMIELGKVETAKMPRLGELGLQAVSLQTASFRPSSGPMLFFLDLPHAQ